jgi:hypothetical protein
MANEHCILAVAGHDWQGQALRLPAAMLLHAGVLGAWAAGDAALIKNLLLQPMRHSSSTRRGISASCAPARPLVAMAPPEVIDIDALDHGPGAYHAGNKIVEAIGPVLTDEFPVGPDFAAAFEKPSTSWRCSSTAGMSPPGTWAQRWSRATFHGGPTGIPGAVPARNPNPVLALPQSARRTGNSPLHRDIAGRRERHEQRDRGRRRIRAKQHMAATGEQGSAEAVVARSACCVPADSVASRPIATIPARILQPLLSPTRRARSSLRRAIWPRQ